MKTTTIYFEEIMVADCPECGHQSIGEDVKLALAEKRPVHCVNCHKMFLVERAETPAEKIVLMGVA